MGAAPLRRQHPEQRRARGAAALFALCLAACTSVPAKVALTGDLPALKASIAQAERQQQLGASGLKELAGAVLERELVSLAPSDVFPDVGACATQIQAALKDVAQGSSEFAAAAALALIDAGYSPGGEPSDPVARAAVEARQALGPDAGLRRRALMLHGDAGVRRAALSAALAMSDPADVPALTEAGRLDPDPEARVIAIRALGHIGGRAALRSLADLYVSADREGRQAILHAWSLPPSFGAGGQHELEDLTRGTSETSVLAASALYGSDPGENVLVTAALVRGIESRVPSVRLLALYVAPWSLEGVRAALVAAREHTDPATRVLALLRAVEAGALDAPGSQALEQLGADDRTPVGVVARAALARAGNGSIKPKLRADLGAQQADRRTLAALSLLSLEDWAGAASALGDDSPSVRRAVACQVLAGSGTRERTAAWEFRPPAFGPATPEVVPLLMAKTPG
jgi:hypothetical protein